MHSLLSKTDYERALFLLMFLNSKLQLRNLGFTVFGSIKFVHRSDTLTTYCSDRVVSVSRYKCLVMLSHLITREMKSKYTLAKRRDDKDFEQTEA